MTQAEAAGILGVTDGASGSAVKAAYQAKVAGWGRKMRLATSMGDRDQASQMLVSLKQAEAVLAVNGKAVPQVAPAGGGPQAGMASPTNSPAPIRRVSDLPKPVKVAAAVLAAVTLMSMTGLSLSGLPRGAEAPTAVSARTRPRGRTAVSIGLAGVKAPAARPAEPSHGFLVVLSFPAAEVFVDGRHVGYSPFVAGERLRLAAGRHVLTLRNPRFAPLTTTVTTKAGVTRELKFWFDSREIRLSERG